MPLLHCPKCCPKKWETVQGVAGSCSHTWDVEKWVEHPTETVEVLPGRFEPRLVAGGPWGWRCENCGHFKKPRAKRTKVPRMSLRYIVTSHRGRPGVRLSKVGHWGNLPFPNETAASEHAKSDADGRPFTIEHKLVTLKLMEFPK